MIARKVCVLVTTSMLIFSLIAVSPQPINAAFHVQTFGYKGRDVLNLSVNITSEDSDYMYSICIVLPTLEYSSFSFVIFSCTYRIASITLISSLMRYTKRR